MKESHGREVATIPTPNHLLSQKLGPRFRAVQDARGRRTGDTSYGRCTGLFLRRRQGEDYFISAAGQAGEEAVQFLEFSSGKVSPIVPLGKETGLGLAVSPDRKHPLFVREEGTGSDLMLVENFR